MKIQLRLLFFHCYVLVPISAAKSDIAIDYNQQSWISDTNMSLIIGLSYPFSACCNIYLDGLDEIEPIFKQFRRIYPHEYLLEKTSFECFGNLVLAATEEQVVMELSRISTAISKSEILVILDKRIESNSSVLNATLYKNSDVNLVSRYGIWKLSENYLLPRSFTKVDRYEELAYSKKGLVDMMGREVHAASFFRPPLSYLKTSINKTINGIPTKIYVTNNEQEMDGIELKLFLIMAEKLNFTYTIREPDGPNRYGIPINDTTWEGGMIGQLHKKQIDIAFASIWQTIHHHKFVNLTEPWYQIFMHFLVPRPKPYTSFWALTRPLSTSVWIALLIIIFLQSLSIYLQAWIDPKIPKRFRDFILTLTETIGRLLGTCVPESCTEVRVQMHIWHAAGVIIVTAYSSSLAARLASSEYEPRIDTIDQFVHSELRWGRIKIKPFREDYFNIEEAYTSDIPDRFIPLETEEEQRKYFATGKYAAVGRVVDSIFFPDDNITNEDLENLRVMKDAIGKFYSSFAVQPWLLNPVNKVMLWLKESGITFFHLRDVIRRRTGLHLREVLVEHDGSDGDARVLTLTPLGAGFSMLIVGLFLSTFVFYLELKSVGDFESYKSRQKLFIGRGE
ncbi:probable glutamate receptor [Prorops nasuta]|uniref:probable glutamate receptor n=1 Tax=Prorops nasuta TaxID=863751 RepID=UPI0034CE9EF6